MRLERTLLVAALGAAPSIGWTQSAVTISGIMDIGVRHDRGTAGGSISSVGSGQLTGSRLTFSGVEDLGDGLKATFVLEAGLALDTGAGAASPPGTPAGTFAFARTSAVALGGEKTGYVSLGRQYTPEWALSGSPSSDPFGGSWLGGVNFVYSNTTRASNSIVYSYGYGPTTMLRPAPRSGLGLAVMYSLPESSAPAPSRSGEQTGFNVSYGTGPWWAGYALHQMRGNNAAINPALPSTDTPRLRQQTAAASYDFGFARLHGGINTGRNGTSLDRRNWSVGATIPITAVQTLRILYGKANDRLATNADFTTVQLGYSYDFSKRTALYVAIGQVDNSRAAATALLGSQGTYAVGATPRSVIAGIRHFF